MHCLRCQPPKDVPTASGATVGDFLAEMPASQRLVLPDADLPEELAEVRDVLYIDIWIYADVGAQVIAAATEPESEDNDDEYEDYDDDSEVRQPRDVIVTTFG